MVLATAAVAALALAVVISLVLDRMTYGHVNALRVTRYAACVMTAPATVLAVFAAGLLIPLFLCGLVLAVAVTFGGTP